MPSSERGGKPREMQQQVVDDGVEVTAEATAVLQREGKRLLIETDGRGGLHLRLVCPLCRGAGVTVYHGGSGLGEVHPCPLCDRAEDDREAP